MNSIERVLTAFDLKVPDKIPFHAYESPEHAIRQLGRKVHEMYLDTELVPAAMIAAAKAYSNDIIYLRHSAFLPTDREAVSDNEGLLIKSRKNGEILGRVFADTKEFIPNTPPVPPVKTVGEIDKLQIISSKELLEEPAMQSMKPYIDAFKGKRFIFGFASSQSANILNNFLGTENAMVATFEDPGLCRALMERGFEARKQEILALQAFGVDGIYTGDACASCSFYSPATYRELFFEYQKRSIDFVHSLGLKALLHICGRNSGILEDMAATGADVIESLDAFSAGGDLELKDAKARVGRLICLKGNIDAVTVIARQTPEQIYKKCIEAMQDAGPDGYILSTEQITRDTPPEHVLAMVQARDDFKL